MLTGPVTILAWSFVQTTSRAARLLTRQVLALFFDEIADLEQAGIRIIQVDEPVCVSCCPCAATSSRSTWTGR